VKKIASSIAFYLILALNGMGYGQTQPDYCLWGEFALEKKISKKLSLEFEEEIRLNQNISRLNYIHSSIGGGYRLNNALKFAFAYRFTGKYTLNDEFSYRHRLNLDASYRYSFSDFTFTYRTRIQSELKNYLSSSNGKNPAWEWRNRFVAKYSHKKISPYVGFEIFYQIKDARNPELDNTWPKHRLYVGVDYKLKKRNEIGVSFLIQRGIDDDEPNELNVIGINYSYTLPSKKN
jgi:hypothetical protein